MNNTDQLRYSTKKYRINVLVIVYIFLLFFDNIVARLPYGNFLDELLSIALFIAMVLNKKQFENKSIVNTISLCSFAMLCLGLVGNFIWGYVTNLGVILRDVVGTFKFLFSFLSVDCICKKNTTIKTKSFVAISKLLITIIFVFGVLSLFLDLGMGDSIRYGIRSYKFIFGYYNILVFAEVLLIATLMCDEKNNRLYYLMSVISLLLTLRTKAVVVVILVLLFQFLEAKKYNPLFYGKITKSLRYIVPFAIIVAFAVKDKLKMYWDWGQYNSIRIGALIEGANILKDHYLLGTGFGTYGTNLSYKTNSILYSMYNNVNYSKMMDAELGYATMSDTYWPSIYTQLGLIGLILFVYCIIQLFIGIRNDTAPEKNRQATILILVYMIIASLSEASFSNSTGVIAGIVMAILLNMSNNMRDWKEE